MALCFRLEVILVKQEIGLMWQELVVGNKDGEEVSDPAVVAEVHSCLAHLTSDKEVTETGDGCAPSFNMDQLEECDAFPTAMTILSRIDVVTHQPTHQVIYLSLIHIYSLSRYKLRQEIKSNMNAAGVDVSERDTIF